MISTVDELLGGLDPDAWDRLAGSSFYSTAAWLKFCADHGGPRRGAIVSHADGQPAAAVPVAMVTDQLPPPLYRWNDLLAERGLPTLASNGLLVGPLQGYRTQLLTAPGVDGIDAARGLIHALRDRGDAACVATYVPTEDARSLVAAGVSAPPVLLDTDAWIELPPGGWEAWLDALPKKRRTSVRRERRAFEEAGYTVTHLPLADCHERLAPLAAATQAKYGHDAPEAFWGGLLQLHVADMGAAARVSVCWHGDDPVGFCLYYVWGDTLYLRWAGFAYERLAGAAEYFNLVYYDQVMQAPTLGVRWIHAGIKASEAKALRGAELRPLWLVDLAADSVLATRRDDVRDHTLRTVEGLLADNRTRAAVRDPDSWLAFT